MQKVRTLLSVCLIVLATYSTNASADDSNSWASVDLSVGYNVTHYNESGTFILKGSAGVGNLSATTYATVVDGDPTLVIASARVSTDYIDIDVGRIGLSFGITPAAYSVAVQPAYEPDIYNTSSRILLKSIGLPDIGAAVTIKAGNYQFFVKGYSPSETSKKSFQQITALTPFKSATDVGPLTPNVCTLCSVVNTLLGTKIDTNELDGLLINNTQKFEVLDINTSEVYQIGGYWADFNTQAALDYTSVHINDQEIGIYSIGFEQSYAKATLGLQPTIVQGLVDAQILSAYAVFPFETSYINVLPFARGLVSEGDLVMREYALGVVFKYKGFALRTSYEYILFQSVVNEEQAVVQGYSAAASYSF